MNIQMRFVPYEPTEQMRKAAVGVWKLNINADGSVDTPVVRLYKAMLEAAPDVTLTPAEGEVRRLQAELFAERARREKAEEVVDMVIEDIFEPGELAKAYRAQYPRVEKEAP